MTRVLVVRNDKVGDFMLAWPALALLKKAGCWVSVLVPAYTMDLAQACPYVDDVIVDPGKDAAFEKQKALLAEVVDRQFDAALTLYSTWRTAVLLRQASIAYRLAPATKLAQILYTRRITQRRSRSEKPEWQYNLDLAAILLKDLGKPIESVSAPYWQFAERTRAQTRESLAQSLSLPIDSNWLMVHVGSGGSANNLTLQQYESLLVLLSEQLSNWVFVLTAGPSEQAAVGRVLANLINRRVPVVMLQGQTLTQFALTISTAEAFMAGSTGPLHIAGALDVPTIGFYTKRLSATALRWQTLNSKSNRLAISPHQAMPDQQTFAGLDLEQTSREIATWLAGHVRYLS